MIVFIVSGIWHGVGITFIIWGFIHGIFMVIFRVNSDILEKWKSNSHNIGLIQKAKSFKYYKSIRYVYKLIGWFITFQLVTFAWIFFRSPDIQIALLIIKKVYLGETKLNLGSISKPIFLIFIFSAIIILIVDLAQYKLKTHEIFTDLPWLIKGSIYSFLIILIITFSNIYIDVDPFIYQGF